MEKPHTKPRELISILAAIGAPAYVAWRLLTGGPNFWLVMLCVFAVVAVAYLCFVVPGLSRTSDVEDEPVNHPNPTPTTPPESN